MLLPLFISILRGVNYPLTHRQASMIGRAGFFIVLLSLAAVLSASAQNSVLSIDRENFASVYFSPADANFSAQTSSSPSGVTISVSAPSNFYSLYFAAPAGAVLAAGVYENAVFFPEPNSNQPALRISGGNIGGCSSSTGRFEVRQIVFTGNQVTAFHATFEQGCPGQTPAIGEVLFNSSNPVPPRNHLTSPSTAFGPKGQPFRYQIRGSNNPTSFTATGLPPGLTVAAGTGLISGTPTMEGSFPVEINASGTAGSAMGTLNLTITPPGQSTGPHTTLFLKSDPGDFVGQGQTYLYQSADGSFSAQKQGNSGVAVSYNGSPAVNWYISTSAPTGETLQVGTYTNAQRFGSSTRPGLDVSGLARGCNQTTGEFEVKELKVVNNIVSSYRVSFEQHCEGAVPALRGEVWVNVANTVTSNPAANATVNAPFSYQIVANNLPTTYSAFALPPGLTMDSASGVISGTPTLAGSYSVLLSVAGNAAAPATGRLMLTVGGGTAGAPVITSSARATSVVGQAFTYQITATNNPTTFSATGLPPGLTLNPETGVISGSVNQTGTFGVVLSATNANGSAGASLNIQINPLPPVITSAASATAAQGQPFSFQVVATNQPTNYAATGLPGGLAINSETGLISGSSTLSGSFSIVLLARNNGGTGSQNFTLSVTQSAPTITSATSATGKVNQFFNYQITATSSPTSFNATGLPGGLSVNASSGSIAGSPTASGDFMVTLFATNSVGTGSRALMLSISPPAPTLSGPLSVTGAQGQPFSFQITASGNPTSYGATNIPAGLSINTATGLISGTPTTPGDFFLSISATNAFGSDSRSLQIRITLPPPTINSPASASGTQGEPFSFQVTASESPTSFSATGLPSGLSINTTTGLISGTPAVAGNVSVTLSATNSFGTGTQTLSLAIAQAARFANISTRSTVGTGDNVLIGGFIIVGNAPKKVIVRAIGPSLSVNGAPLPGRLGNPELELFQNGASLAINDDWRQTQEQEIIASTVPPGSDQESAIIITLAPGSYTVIVRGKTNGTGVALVEVYDLEPGADSTLANISTRGVVASGDQLIGGIIITGTGTQKTLIRALGPSLGTAGVAQALADPALEIFNSNGTSVALNNNWMDSQAADVQATGIPPSDARESAIVTTFQPGAFTAIVRGNDGRSGVALVEFYILQP